MRTRAELISDSYDRHQESCAETQYELPAVCAAGVPKVYVIHVFRDYAYAACICALATEQNNVCIMACSLPGIGTRGFCGKQPCGRACCKACLGSLLKACSMPF